MAGLAAGIAALSAAKGTRAAAGDPLIVGQVNDGGGETTTLTSRTADAALVVRNRGVGIGGPGTALRVRGDLEVLGGNITMVTRLRRNMYVQARENAITAVSTYRLAKESTITATHNGGGVAVEGRSETKSWYGAGVYCRGQLVVQPGCGIAAVPAGEDSVDVTFDKKITLGEESIVLATPQADAEIGVLRATFLNEKTLRITLAGPAPKATKVGYLVVKYS